MQFDPQHGSPWETLAGIALALSIAYTAGSIAGRSVAPEIVSFQDLDRPLKGRSNPKGQPAYSSLDPADEGTAFQGSNPG
jgi:hypothetical protein